jgi:spermidine dehydrogenase
MKDKDLGLDRPITRRDLIQGLGALAGTAVLPGRALADAVLAMERGNAPYPPALTGLRGNHTGSWEVAHALAREGKREWDPIYRDDKTEYDLVVVGAGLSGLAAAHFWRQSHPDARILILDNHDDFGGHAKRNEFNVGGHSLIGYGGSQSLEEPGDYKDSTKALLDDLGVKLSRFDSAYDRDFYRRNNLGAATFFNKKDWGRDQLLPYDLGGLGYYLPLAPTTLTTADAVQQMPMSEAARAEMLRLLTEDKDRIPEISADNKETYLYSISYRSFLEKHLGIHEAEVFAALQNLSPDSGVGIDRATAGMAILYSGLPGFGATGMPESEDEPYVHHFPDGNASIARLLVRQMIPGVAPGTTMEDIVTARFDYSELDQSDSAVRLRLNSTVSRVEHDGDPKTSKKVGVSYVRDGKAFQVQARSCILACYNAMIPYIAPELPQTQREALASQVKTPILYTNVALRNWRAWEKLGIGAVSAPNGYHVNAMLDFPVSLGGYRFSGSPDDPIIVQMQRFPHRNNEGLGRREQFRLGRHELLSTPYETIERHVRRQLTDILAGGGFDPARDIQGITVNRWAHGYAYGYDWLEEPYYDNWDDERYPHVRARKPFGRIAIANSDAGASASLDSAVAQAYRAVGELT